MKKTAYIKPFTEVVKINGNALMESWSIGVDNDPGHAINPGEEDDIGAKKDFFFENTFNKSLWED
ncbi:MAG: hypothetical protein ACTTKN_12235 [Phocaeicola sp.]|uniref:hypothetical protein n=1 Tax=Bacteroidales TaxID=171549 RepID=UPI003F9FAE36